MADFVAVMKERNRMCNKFKRCSDCPLGISFNQSQPCRNWMIDHPEEAQEIILKWSEENPATTNRMKLKEVFGFDVALMFEVTTGNCVWLNSEYKEV